MFWRYKSDSPFLSGIDTVWIQVQGLLSEADKSKRANQTLRPYPGTIRGSADKYNRARLNAMLKTDRVNTGKVCTQTKSLVPALVEC